MSTHTPGYDVTRDGQVFSVAHNWRGYGRRELRQTPNDSGYPSVRLTIDGRRRRVAVHVLVAQSFLPPRPSPRHEIRHLNGDKSDPRSVNLAWGTPKDNADDREGHGRTSRGASHADAVRVGLPNALSALQREEILRLRGTPQRAIAAQVGCSQSGVSGVLRRTP